MMRFLALFAVLSLSLIGGVLSDNFMCCTPPKIAHGTVSHAAGDPDLTRNFTCKLGYQVVGSNTITCNSCGHWEVDGICQEYKPQCGLPPAIDNGKVQDGGSLVGDSRQVSCNANGTLCGSSSITCTQNGWTTAPLCKPSKYFLLKGTYSWNNAQTQCQQNSGRLAMPKTADDLSAITTVLGGESATTFCKTGYYWVGASSTNSSAPYLWNDGTAVNNQASVFKLNLNQWGCDGQLNAACVAIETNGTFDDLRCASSIVVVNGAVCEYSC